MADETLALMFEKLQAAEWKMGAFRTILAEIGTTAASTLTEEGIQDWGDGGRLGDALLGIKDLVADTLKETEPKFHCYSCHEDKPRSERGRITSATCLICEEASLPRLHPELYDHKRPELMIAYRQEQERKKAACPRCNKQGHV